MTAVDPLVTHPSDLVKTKGLLQPVLGLHDDPASLSVERDALRSDLAVEEDGLPRSLPERKEEGILGDLSLDGFSRGGLRSEEAIRWDQTIQGLMGTLEVVMREEVREVLPGVLKVFWIAALPELAIDGFPETLALSQGLRMVGPGDDMRDAILLERLLEGRLATPGVVLASLVRQDFAGLSVLRDGGPEGLDDEIGLLVHGERKADDEAAVVVQEDGEVDRLAVTSEDEAGDVALPELVRPRALETSDALRFGSPAGLLHGLLFVALGADDALDGPSADGDPVLSPEEVTDLPNPEPRELALAGDDGVANGFRLDLPSRAHGPSASPRLKAFGSRFAVLREPRLKGAGGGPEELRKDVSGKVGLLETFDRGALLLRGKGPPLRGTRIPVLVEAQAAPSIKQCCGAPGASCEGWSAEPRALPIFEERFLLLRGPRASRP